LPTKQAITVQTEEEHASKVLNRQKRFGVVLAEERPKKKPCVDAKQNQSLGTHKQSFGIHNNRKHPVEAYDRQPLAHNKRKQPVGTHNLL